MIGRYAFRNCPELTVTALGKSIAVDGWDVYWLDENASVIWELAPESEENTETTNGGIL